MTTEEPTGGGPVLTPRLLIVAAVLFGVVTFALVAVLTRSPSPAAAGSSSAARHPAQTGRHAGTPSRTASGATNPATAAGSCNVPEGQQAIPVSSPAGVTWHLYNTVALPFSAHAGPTDVTGDVARCYAHSPTGALLAAVQIAVRYVLAGNWQSVIDQQVMPGTGRNVYADQRSAANFTIQAGEFGQVAAFQFITYSRALAVVQIVIQLPSGTMQATTMTVQWSGGDWHLQLQPDGSPGPNVEQVTSLTGFIPWGGV